MAEVDQGLERARATLLAHVNDQIRGEERFYASLGVNKAPRPLCTAAQIATWQITLYEEWLIFTPPGDNYGSSVYLVSEGTAYQVDVPRESYEEALQAARALKARAGR